MLMRRISRRNRTMRREWEVGLANGTGVMTVMKGNAICAHETRVMHDVITYTVL